jgi:hypothetical protein
LNEAGLIVSHPSFTSPTECVAPDPERPVSHLTARSVTTPVFADISSYEPFEAAGVLTTLRPALTTLGTGAMNVMIPRSLWKVLCG